MSLFPKIERPCPYKANLVAVMDGGMCRMCKREVHDITAMSDAERFAFLDACEGEVCVSYSVIAKPALAVLAAGAMLSALPAAAQETAPQASEDNSLDDMQIIVGGLRKPKQAKWVKHEAAPKAPTLPVVYEDAPPVPAHKRS